MCSASLAASVYALGTSAWGRHDPFAEPPVNGRYLRAADGPFRRILLKKSETEVPRKSRFRAHSVFYTGSCHSQA
jgi:hypothetical protein